MEVGFLIYFLIVFGLGGLLLLVLTVYSVREIFIKREPWNHRSKRSKAFLCTAIALIAVVLYLPCRMIWLTRVGAVPGTYRADGVWGTATLDVRADGRFVETWQFKNEYTGKAEGTGSQQGFWQDSRREWLTRELILKSFRPLASYDREHTLTTMIANVAGYSGATAIEVDSGADIVFFK